MAKRASDGIALLAALTGHPEDAMRRDWRALRTGVLALGKTSIQIIQGYASEDPAVREAAYRRWAELDAMLPKAEPPGPERLAGLSEANRVRLRAGLTKVVETLQDIEQSTREEVTRETGSAD